MSVPQSTIYFCEGVPLHNDYRHTIYFATTQERLKYFNTKKRVSKSNYTFLRDDWAIKVDIPFPEARKYNYIYFRNEEPRYYFYFITKVEYISDTVSKFYIEMDVIQSYDFELLPCFVDREHTRTDEIGDNLVDESLELGEYIISAKKPLNELDELAIVVQSTVNMQSDPTNPSKIVSAHYDGVFSGLALFGITMDDYHALGVLLNAYDSKGISDAVINIWMYPKSVLSVTDEGGWDANIVAHSLGNCKTIPVSVMRNDALNGYTPKNRKLLTYPYNFIYVTNNNGSACVYQFERFDNPESCDFDIVGCLSPDATVKIYPKNYKNKSHNYEEGLLSGQYPTCAWNQDIYKLWVAQNQNQKDFSQAMNGLKVVGGVVATVGSIAMGNVVGAGAGVVTALSGASSIAETLALKKDKEIQPPQARGNQSSTLNVSQDFHGFEILYKCIDEQHARIIDDYFSMYGYKCNRVKIPNIIGRENWMYCKTIGCKIKANIPHDDIQKIQSIFDNGITFWVNGDNVGDYSLSNRCLSEVEQ